MTLARVTIYGTYGGNGHVNVLHFRQEAPSDAEWEGLGQAIRDFWVDWHRLNVDNKMSWHLIHVKDMSGSRGEYDWATTGNGVLGPSVSYVPFVSACFLFKTALGGPAGRGRHFQGGYGHGGGYSDGAWNTATKNRIDGVATELTNYWLTPNSFTLGWLLCVAKRDATVDDDGHFVTEIVGRSRVSSMNTRKIGRGL